MDDIEIEVRIKLNKRELDLFLQWLKKSAKLIKISDQTDFYFEPPGKSFIYIDPEGYKDADEWFRVRISNNDEICYKKWYRDKETGKSLYADEIETSVKDGKKILKILQKMHFKKISVIKKHRESWQYNDFNFDFDEIKGLGFFVEIEYKGEINNPSRGREIIFNLLKEIGIKNYKIIKRGYSWMQWNPNKNHFEE